MTAREAAGGVIRVKCLLVDDLPENLLALSALLRSDDVELLTARSGTEALELLLVHDVALALLDVQMPEMDGFELAELIRGSERTRGVPLIFVTAGSRDQHRLFRGYESGAVDFLYKPIDPKILRNKADVFFQLHRQKRQLAEELRERSETLRLNEMFVAMLGHDLRNPLTAILTAAALLQRRSTDEAVQHTARQMLEGGRRMNRMIEYLLDLTRARLAGGIALRRAPATLGGVVRQVVAELVGNGRSHRVEVSESGDLAGVFDADRLAQVASNLIGNALHHGETGEPVRVELDGSEADRLAMRVVNAGSIDPEVLPHIFDPFRGGDRGSAAGGEGLGLGLYIVQQIVDAHGGTIEANVADPGFTTFVVRLPRGTLAAVPTGADRG